ncbi:fibulin-1 [Protopterus annectens]|uniref:fibulin-1 n=1 Tax=Protopterus annectens TaxID=7888 RepID=UPI001CF9B143|nr:fibulin-1 [Protopterus annectens]
MDTMKLFLSVLMGIVHFLALQAAAQLTELECCKLGNSWATQKQTCASLPHGSETTDCRVIQELCCSTALEDSYCKAGIQMYTDTDKTCQLAQNFSSCEETFVKKCCHCCRLGKAAQLRGGSCETDKLGYSCGQAFRACCVAGTPAESSDRVSEARHEENLYTDNCKASPCTQGCRDTGDGVSCYCYPGYHLKLDGITCEDMNECLAFSNLCQTGEKCINLPGSFRCQRVISCGTGYELMDNNVCQDIDECKMGTDNCPPETICQNTQGSFRCRPREVCSNGYNQDALGRCIDINECLGNPCPVGQGCMNTPGSYTCQRNVMSCSQGYQVNAEGTRCVDIDECSEGTTPCGRGHTCVNVIGSYRCDCLMGYYFDSISRRCVDIDECRRYPGRLCAHKCENTPGSFHCSCTMGFKLSADGRNCEDINECDSNPCSQECANVYGSFQCYCRRGYQLSDFDGITCEDIDECALPTGGHICAYRCHNVPGSFRCSCPSSGYTLAPNGRSCQDIDECVTATHNCSGTETCFNIQGSFRCLAFECPKNYQKSGDTGERVETVRCTKYCRGNDMTCISNPVHTISHTVVSLPTFRDFTNPEEIVFLRAISPSYYPSQTDIIFDITEGNTRNSFDIIKRIDNSATIGVVRQIKQITGPFSNVLKLEMNNVVDGIIASRNVVYVHIFVSEYWF